MVKPLECGGKVRGCAEKEEGRLPVARRRVADLEKATHARRPEITQHDVHALSSQGAFRFASLSRLEHSREEARALDRFLDLPATALGVVHQEDR
jgi:hypothetical protein